MKGQTFLVFIAITFVFLGIVLVQRSEKFEINFPPQSEKAEKIIFVGDTGTGGSPQYEVAKAMEEYCQIEICQAAFILGDVIYDSGVESVDDPQFQTKFEEPYKSLNFPFYIAFGNHDYLGCTTCYLEYTDKSAKWHMPDYYYVQSLGAIDVFVIDTENFNADQANWLRKSLQTSVATWKIVAGHRPLVSYEVEKYGENWTGMSELQDLVCNKAHFYISGHAHAMEQNSVPNCNVMQLISGGGGANLREFEPNSKGLYSASFHGFVSLSVNERGLEAEFIDTIGEVEHKVLLKN